MLSQYLREDFALQLKSEHRKMCLATAGIVIFFFPLWSIFDASFLPERAGEFLAARLVGILPAIICFPLLLWHRWGKSHPEAMLCLTIVVPELCVAFMLPKSGEALPVYLLGYSIGIYAATLVLWRFSWTAFTISIAVLAPFVSFALADELTPSNIVLLSLHLGTNGVISACVSLIQIQSRFREFVAKREAIDERNTTLQLLSQLEYLSKHDELTDLANRRFWSEELARGWASSSSLAVALVDIDYFKAVNDGFGHQLGDEVLLSIARLLKTTAGDRHLAARLGGDEMAILFRSAGQSDTELAGYELLDRVRQLRFKDDPDLRVTVSIGIAERNADMSDSSVLIQLADRRLYLAKESRNRVVVDDLPAVTRVDEIAPGSETTFATSEEQHRSE